jgi:hypothetical protein
VDEAVILDHHVTGLLTGHPAGAALLPPSGITPAGRYTTPGRYFLEYGNGWGHTRIGCPRDAIVAVDPRQRGPA